jgi:hypothetical protein
MSTLDGAKLQPQLAPDFRRSGTYSVPGESTRDLIDTNIVIHLASVDPAQLPDEMVIAQSPLLNCRPGRTTRMILLNARDERASYSTPRPRSNPCRSTPMRLGLWDGLRSRTGIRA